MPGAEVRVGGYAGESGRCAGEEEGRRRRRPHPRLPIMPAIPPSLEDLSLELLVNNVQAYADAHGKDEQTSASVRRAACGSRHPFYHPPPYDVEPAPEQAPSLPSNIHLQALSDLSQSISALRSPRSPSVNEAHFVRSPTHHSPSPTPMDVTVCPHRDPSEDREETEQRPLPACLGNKLLVGVKDRGCLNPNTLALFRRSYVRLTHADLSEITELNEDDLEMLSEHELDALELRGLSGVDLGRVLERSLSPGTRQRLELLDLSYALTKSAIRLSAASDSGSSGGSGKPRKAILFAGFGRGLGKREREGGGGSGSDTSASLLEEDTAAKSAIPWNIRKSLIGLEALQSLKLAGTALDNAALRQLVPALPLLHSLDISATQVSDLSPLLAARARLRNLILFGTPVVDVSVLVQLNALEVLDISDASSMGQHANQATNARSFLGKLLLQESDEQWRNMELIVCPELRILDFSGLHGHVNGSVLSQFLRNHCRLRYLGLIRNPLRHCFDELKEFPHLMVASDLDLAQILVGLRLARGSVGRGAGGCRWKEREPFLSAQLHAAFSELHQNYEAIGESQLLELLGLVLCGMGGLVSSVGIQMAATACLYNLCRSQRAAHFPNHLLGQVVTRCLDALQAHPNVSQLAKNVWLTLCNDQILQTGQFDLYRCCHLALESMVTHPNEAAITRMTVAIVSILAAKIPIERTTTLGANARYMEFMLNIVQGKLEEHYANLQHLPPNHNPPAPDVTLKFTLSALWNLTDESPGTSEQFLQHDGLDVVLKVLETYNDEPSIQTKILGLLNNVAEVERLKDSLASHPVLRAIVELLGSEKIEVSYFAAGILAHLCVGRPWDTRPNWQEALHALEARIRLWGRPENEMVAYRSFRPFFPLLCRDDLPGVQLWAVWAVRHVCGKSESRYLPLFLDEDGDKAIQALQEIMERSSVEGMERGEGEEEESTSQLIRALCEEIMSRIRLHRRRSPSASRSRSQSPAPRPIA